MAWVLLVGLIGTFLAPGAAGADTVIATGSQHAVGAKAYVALYVDGGVAFFDTDTNQSLGYFGGLLDPVGLAASPDGRIVYVGSDLVPTVTSIDTATDRIVAVTNVGGGQRGLTMSPSGGHLLVSIWTANQVVNVDTERHEIVARFPVASPERSAITPDGRKAYVISANPEAPALVVLDLAKRTAVGRIPMDDTPLELQFGPDGRRLYVTLAHHDDVFVVDSERDRVVGRILVDPGLRDPLPGRDGVSMLILSQALGTLDVVDVVRGVVRMRIPVGGHPSWAAAAANGRTAYVTNASSDDVSVVDLVRGTVVATIPIGHGQSEIALPPKPAGGPTMPATVP
jgi:YVTN family beta-propeller protein